MPVTACATTAVSTMAPPARVSEEERAAVLVDGLDAAEDRAQRDAPDAGLERNREGFGHGLRRRRHPAVTPHRCATALASVRKSR